MGRKCQKCHFETAGEAPVCGRCGAPLPGLGAPADPGMTTTLAYLSGSLSDGVLFAGRYLVIEELGKGGMGCVYRVLDTRVDEEVALKFLNPDVAADTKAIERFRAELRITRRIVHHNVCRTYDIGQEGKSLFITMEYIAGEDLAHMINRLDRLPVEKAFLIAKQVCEGLAEVHGMGVVHRDLKPKNIMIDREGHAKIMDFGLARTPHGVRLTEVGHVVGTPSFMSPEQLDGEVVDARADIFALGVTMYDMLTGTLPFQAETTTALALQHRTHRPPGLHVLNPRVPEDLSRIVLKCLEIDKTARYASAQDLLADLQKAGRRFETYAFSVSKKPGAGLAGVLRRSLAARVAAGAVVLLVVASGLAFRSLLRKSRERGPVSPVVKIDVPVKTEPAPPPIEMVKVTLVTTPSGAAVDVDGVARGTADGILELVPGTHTIRIDKPGYREIKSTLVVESGGTGTLRKEFSLVPLPPARGTLLVTSEPPEATVYLGNSQKPAGKTPFTQDLPAGKILVRLRLDGYGERTGEVDIRAGDRSEFSGPLTPLDGVVQIASEPQGAEVYNGSELIGTTPFSRPLPPGVYRLRILWKGSGETEDVVAVRPGETLVTPVYAPPPQAAPPEALRYYLKITTDPPGASVMINGVLQKELTPFVWELSTNEVKVRVEKEGYNSREELVYIRPAPARNAHSFDLKRSKDPAEAGRLRDW